MQPLIFNGPSSRIADYCLKMQNSESKALDTRPKRRMSVPSYLSDYDLSGPGAQSRSRTAAAGESLEEQSGLVRPTARSPSPPISQSFDMMDLRDDMEQERELCQSMEQVTREQQTSQVPEFSVALEEMRQENAELRKQFQSLMVALQSQPAAHQPLFPPPPPQSVYSGGYGPHQPPTNSPAYQQLQYPTFSSRRNLRLDFTNPRVSQTSGGLHQSLYYADTPQQSAPSYSHRDSSFVQVPSFNEPQRETTYRGPKPTIPRFTSPDPREFARMKIALENLLPGDATERYKYQILTDHLQCEEASLVADSYCNSRQPYTDTMLALSVAH
ncbi:uncharacterized protein LOC106943301 [Poecilia latipinna]|uniref:uncharacterized protein LOC106943301 n=1 Tax=Poecilia latipinna TaxID=48699 RepID=UPI00072E76C9|nr:PREDICTED: uncharacterized protein LOC106943301 [Poecilia latipinna]